MPVRVLYLLLMEADRRRDWIMRDLEQKARNAIRVIAYPARAED